MLVIIHSQELLCASAILYSQQQLAEILVLHDAAVVAVGRPAGCQWRDGRTRIGCWILRERRLVVCDDDDDENVCCGLGFD